MSFCVLRDQRPELISDNVYYPNRRHSVDLWCIRRMEIRNIMLEGISSRIFFLDFHPSSLYTQYINKNKSVKSG